MRVAGTPLPGTIIHRLAALAFAIVLGPSPLEAQIECAISGPSEARPGEPFELFVGQPRCSIGGPSAVAEGQIFTLCGPSGPGLRYSWTGPGVGSDSTARCIVLSPTGSGTHTYRLRVLGLAAPWSCEKTVIVGGMSSPGGCPRSKVFWRNACDLAGLEREPVQGAAIAADAGSIRLATPHGCRLPVPARGT